MALGMDGEEILSHLLQARSSTSATKDGWRMPFDAERMKGVKAVDRPDRRQDRRGRGRGRQEADRPLGRASSPRRASRPCARTDEDLYGQYIAEDLVNPQTGEIFAEAGDEITDEVAEGADRERASTSCRSSTSTTSMSAPTSATRWRSTRTRRARTRCSTSIASCVPASRRRSTPPKRCSSRCSSTASATTSRPSAASR